jgi:hypothetical protein
MARTAEFKLEFNDGDEFLIERCAKTCGTDFDQFVAARTREWFTQALDLLRQDMARRLAERLEGDARPPSNAWPDPPFGKPRHR